MLSMHARAGILVTLAEKAVLLFRHKECTHKTLCCLFPVGQRTWWTKGQVLSTTCMLAQSDGVALMRDFIIVPGGTTGILLPEQNEDWRVDAMTQ